MTVHNRSALIIFVLGAVWAVLFFFFIQDVYHALSNWEIGKNRLNFRHALVGVGYLVWLSWALMAFGQRGSWASMVVWPITIFYSAFTILFDLLVAVFVPWLIIYFVWHVFTIVIAYRSFWKDWALFDAARKTQTS